MIKINLLIGSGINYKNYFVKLKIIDIKSKTIIKNVQREFLDADNVVEFIRENCKNFNLVSKFTQQTKKYFELSNEIMSRFNWLECSQEYLIKQERCLRSLVFWGGYLRLENIQINVPFGVVDNDHNICNLLKSKIVEFDLACENLKCVDFETYLETDTCSLNFSNFSSGIFAHEFFGHLSEGDVAIRENLSVNLNAICPGLEVYDLANGENRFNYSIADNGDSINNKVNLLENSMSIRTGNSFLGVTELGELSESLRQRNLEVIAIEKLNQKNPYKCIILAAGLNSKTGDLTLRCSLGINSFNLVFNVSEIKKIYSTDTKIISYATYCWKKKSPQLITLTNPQLSVDLIKPIKEYLR
ncbi:TPA: hypothetical protein ACGO7C_001350 [Streptococcus suis]